MLVKAVAQFSGPFDCWRPPTAWPRRRRWLLRPSVGRPYRATGEKLVKITWPDCEEVVAVVTGSESCVARASGKTEERRLFVWRLVCHLETSTRRKIDKKSRGAGGGWVALYHHTARPGPARHGFLSPASAVCWACPVLLWPSSRRRHRATCLSNLSADSRRQRRSTKSVISSMNAGDSAGSVGARWCPVNFLRVLRLLLWVIQLHRNKARVRVKRGTQGMESVRRVRPWLRVK